MRIFKLAVAQNDPKKLGRFLYKKGFSKRAVKNAKHHHGMILVNHKIRRSSFALRAGDVVHFVMGQEKRNHWLKPSQKPLNIVRENSDWLVINKPAGLLSIPSRYEDNDALVNRLLGYFVKTGQDPAVVKPHVVTRLDRNTSGLVLVAKNAVAAARLSRISKDLFIKKYRAIVHGNFPKSMLEGMIDLPIAKTSSSVKRQVDPRGQESRTYYRVLQQAKGASLVSVRLFTGRTHQIRVHFSHIGHPLFGDALYGVQDDFPRQALNCCSLAFPERGRQEIIRIGDPSDMKELWLRLRRVD